jgi:hypothetical protein
LPINACVLLQTLIQRSESRHRLDVCPFGLDACLLLCECLLGLLACLRQFLRLSRVIGLPKDCVLQLRRECVFFPLVLDFLKNIWVNALRIAIGVVGLVCSGVASDLGLRLVERGLREFRRFRQIVLCVVHVFPK